MSNSRLKSNPEKTKDWIQRSRKPLPKMGKRGLKRQAMNRKLNQLGITRCEIRIPGVCVDSIMLSWAHSKKSRFLITDEDWLHACRACVPCHNIIEAKSHEEMFEIVSNAINRRPKPKGT